MFRDSVIDSFVMAANEYQMLFPAEFNGDLLSKASSSWRHQNHMRSLGSERFDGGKDRFRFHNHPRSAPVGRFIGHMMFVASPIPYIQASDLNEEVFLSFLQDAFRKKTRAELRKKRQNVKSKHTRLYH